MLYGGQSIHPSANRTSKDSFDYTRQRRIGQEAYPRVLRGRGSDREFGGLPTEGKFGGAEMMARLSALGVLLHLLIVGKTVATAQKVRRRHMSEKFCSYRYVPSLLDELLTVTVVRKSEKLTLSMVYLPGECASALSTLGISNRNPLEDGDSYNLTVGADGRFEHKYASHFFSVVSRICPSLHQSSAPVQQLQQQQCFINCTLVRSTGRMFEPLSYYVHTVMLLLVVQLCTKGDLQIYKTGSAGI